MSGAGGGAAAPSLASIRDKVRAGEPLFFEALTGIFIGLLACAAAACTFDVRRREARLS